MRNATLTMSLTTSMKEPDPFSAELGALLARLRLCHDVSQEYVAQAVGLTRGSIANIEAGRQGISAQMLCELLAVFGMGLIVIED